MKEPQVLQLNNSKKEKIKDSIILIIDEATMMNKLLFKTIDLTLKDVMKNNYFMGGKILLLGGDWKQTLPIIPKGSQTEIMSNTIKFHINWPDLIQFTFSQNMRVINNNYEWINCLEMIGNGEINEFNIPFFMKSESLEDLIDFVFADTFFNDYQYSNSSILCTTNDGAKMINEMILQKIPGNLNVFKSIDTVVEDVNPKYITTEFINSLNPPGLPQHDLKIKEGIPVMLLRNLSTKDGLNNGTILKITKIRSRVLEVEILEGAKKGSKHLIPRIGLFSKELSYPFIFKRFQFPIAPAFAITINKSQGKTLDKIGIFLDKPIFSHGQLYVALSRSKSPENIKLFCQMEKIQNIVFHDIFKIN